MIKEIIFDISGILISSDEKDTLNYYSEKLNIPLEKIQEAHNKYMNSYERGELSSEEYKKLFFGELNVEVDPGYWDVKLSFKRKFENVFAFVKGLGINYSIYYVSNEGKEYWKTVDNEFKISEIFKDGIVSYQVGVRKPDIKIFKMLVDKHNLVAEECLFIDDNKKNLGGAEALGMKTLHFTDLEQLKEDLNCIGVKL
jgi:FMN phosphatase YigB (HAD superfamily)